MTKETDLDRLILDVKYRHPFKPKNGGGERKIFEMHPARKIQGSGAGYFVIREESGLRRQQFISETELAEMFAVNGFTSLGITLRMLPAGDYPGGAAPGLQPSLEDVTAGSIFESEVQKQRVRIQRFGLSENLYSKLTDIGVRPSSDLMPMESKELAFDGASGLVSRDLLAPEQSLSPVDTHSSVDVDIGSLKGTGYEPDAEKRRAIEIYAVKRATEFYIERNYEVEAKGKPYDLRCTKGNEELHVEVKGSRSLMSAIIVTRNEVADARDERWRSDLFLVDGIELGDLVDGIYVPAGGRCRRKENWSPNQEDLTEIQFRYTLPPIPDAE